ncbi:MAG: carbohydrate-binding protein, partial [Moraxellaceae bacterium]
MLKIFSIKNNIGRLLLASCTTLLAPLVSAAVYQAEDYTYSYDTTAGNTGGVYRTNDVDIQATSDTGGGYNVGWIVANEWLSFSNVTIASSGNYKVRLRVASPAAGGVATIDFNGGTILLGNANIPATGGWQTWQTVEFTTNMTAGTYSLGVFAKVAGWNFNWIEIVKNDPVTPTGVVTGYQHCTYGGWASALDVGSYNQAALTAKGFVNNDASSIKVTAGYEAVLYKDDNFAGESTVISADETCLVAKNFNDQVSSVVVRKATTATST